MKTKLDYTVLVFLLVGAVLLVLSILGVFESGWVLPGALFFIFSANLMNLLRLKKTDRK